MPWDLFKVISFMEEKKIVIGLHILSSEGGKLHGDYDVGEPQN